MATIKDLAEQYGLEDYQQLLGGYPNATKFVNALQSGIESHIPTTEDLQSPERMGEWSLAAALNQPTGLATKPIKNLNQALLDKYIERGYLPEDELSKYEKNAAKMRNAGRQDINVQNAQANPEYEAYKAEYDVPFMHGTERLDRVLSKEGLDPKRATSGPMLYGTDSPEIASSYAKNKQDTSMMDDEDWDYSKAFTVAPQQLGHRGTIPYTVEQSWNYLDPEVRRDILTKAPRVGYSDLDQWQGDFVLHPEGEGDAIDKSHYDYILKNSRGNPLKAMRDYWLDSGNLFNEEEKMSQLYRLAGYPHEISQEMAPWTKREGVLTGVSRIRNPLDTSNVDELREKVIPALKDAFKNDRSRKKDYGADSWDKNTRYTPKEWVNELEDDLNKGEKSYVWTSIPDKITSELKRLGYNGIYDTGGKSAGADSHQVTIPFNPSQIRSKFAAFDPILKHSPNLLAGTALGSVLLHDDDQGYAQGGSVDKDSLQLNKPQRTPSHPTKSHIVKTMVDGKEKIIRFGEQGAETAGKPKEGESDRMTAKRESFKARHAKNIAKGPSSAAYWANKVKWAEGGEVDIRDDEGYADDLARLKRAYENSNFGPNDSVIASTIHHPIEAAKRAKDSLMRSIDTASGVPREILDESSAFPFGVAPSMDEQAQAGLDLAGLMQTGAMPFAPESAGGVLGTLHKFRIGDLGYDLRFDDRKLEQDKLQNMVLQLSRPENEKRIISLANYEGYPWVTSMSDRTNVGNLHYINDRPVDVDLQGGQDYMFNNPGQVWASAQAPVNAIMKYGKELSERAGGLDPLYMTWRMAPTGGDYANMTGETMLKYMRSNMNKKEQRAVNKGIKDFIPDFKGIESEEGIDQFRNAPDKVRKALKNHLDTKYRNAGGISIGEARLAVADPSQLLAPDTGLQNVGQIYIGNPIIKESGHRAYPRGVPGQGLGVLDRDVMAYDLMPDVAEYRGLIDLKNPRTNDIRALQMKPYGGIITDKILKNLGYAKGGEVKALHDKYAEGGSVNTTPISYGFEYDQMANSLGLNNINYGGLNSGSTKTTTDTPKTIDTTPVTSGLSALTDTPIEKASTIDDASPNKTLTPYIDDNGGNPVGYLNTGMMGPKIKDDGRGSVVYGGDGQYHNRFGYGPDGFHDYATEGHAIFNGQMLTLNEYGKAIREYDQTHGLGGFGNSEKYAKGGSVKDLHNKYEESDYGYGNRPDKTKKGLGYFGELERPDGTGVMTEYSIGVPINGKEMDVPTLVPTLTPDEIRLILHMQDGDDMPRSIVHKAIDHAHQRLSEGKPIFATEEDLYAHGGIVDVLHNDAIEQIMKAFMDSMADDEEPSVPAVSIEITTQNTETPRRGKIPKSIAREAKHG